MHFIPLAKKDGPNPFLFPVALTLFLVALSAASIEAFRRLSEAREKLEFRHGEESVLIALKDRLELHTTVLRGVQSYLLALDQFPTYNQFHSFLAHLNPYRSRLPYGGVQGVGFSARIPAEERERLQSWIREQNGTDITFAPVPEVEEHAIMYLSPLDQRNTKALGFNMLSDPVRKEAMDRARDSGSPAMSGKVILRQEIIFPKQHGFLLYLPVYRGKTIPASVEERRNQLLGFAYSPFRAGDFFSQLLNDLGTNIALAVFDGLPTPENLLHSSLPVEAGISAPKASSTRTINFAGHEWVLLMELRDPVGRGLSLVSLAQAISILAGVGISVAAFFRTRSIIQLEEERLRRAAVIEASIDAVVVTSLEDKIMEFNPAAEELFKIPEKEAVGYRMGDLLIAQRSRPSYNENLERFTSTADAEMIGQRVEVTAKRWDGVEFPAELSIFPVTIGDGIVFTSYVRDLSSSKEMEKNRLRLLDQERDARQKSEEANRIKDEFLATVSHELRTPLNAILGWASIVKNNPAPEVLEQGVDTILRSARVQVQIVNDLLRINNLIIEGNIEPKQPLELKEIVDRAIKSHETSLSEKNIKLTYIPISEDCTVEGNNEWLFQVFWHLVENAIKFSRSEGGNEVEISFRRARKTVQVIIEDKGQGIEADFIPHAIEPFTQEDSTTTRRHGGLGIGLSIVQRAVDLHGGKVTIESRGKDRGTTVTVELPTVRERETAPDQELTGKNIIVISASTEQSELIEQVLEDAGALVKIAESWSDYKESLGSMEKDLMIIDLTKVDESSLSDYRELMRSEKIDVATVGIVEDLSAEYSLSALRAGFHSTVKKPIDTFELLVTAEALTS